MTNSKPTLNRGTRLWQLAIRTAGLLIARDGRVPAARLHRLASDIGYAGSLGQRASGKSKGSAAASAVYQVIRVLDDLGLAYRQDGADDLVAVDVVDLAAWLADELEADALFRRQQQTRQLLQSGKE